MKRKMIPFNLYHVTNGVFINSIKKKGLGGIDPLKKYGLLNVLEEAFLKSEEEIPTHPTIKTFKEITKLMVNQQNEIVKNPYNGAFQKHNFTHGELYLHANEQRAALFAKYHIYGSEILNRVITYLKVFDSEGIEFNYNKRCGNLDLERIMRNKPSTFLIRFKSYDGLNLELEERHDKEELDSILNNEEELKNRIDDPKFSSRLQLKTTDVIESRRLRFFQLRLNPELEEEFDYVLIEK